MNSEYVTMISSICMQLFTCVIVYIFKRLNNKQMKEVIDKYQEVKTSCDQIFEAVSNPTTSRSMVNEPFDALPRIDHLVQQLKDHGYVVNIDATPRV